MTVHRIDRPAGAAKPDFDINFFETVRKYAQLKVRPPQPRATPPYHLEVLPQDDGN